VFYTVKMLLFTSKCAEMYLVARLHPDLLGELTLQSAEGSSTTIVVVVVVVVFVVVFVVVVVLVENKRLIEVSN